jgi:hypothetical protein
LSSLRFIVISPVYSPSLSVRISRPQQSRGVPDLLGVIAAVANQAEHDLGEPDACFFYGIGSAADAWRNLLPSVIESLEQNLEGIGAERSIRKELAGAMPGPVLDRTRPSHFPPPALATKERVGGS